MKALEKIREISHMLAARGIDAAEKEAELLVTRGLDINLVDLYKNNPDLDHKKSLSLDHMAERRSRREPLQYILGYCSFLGLKLLVGSGVLIPRPETELMAEHAIKAVSDQRAALRTQKKSTLEAPFSTLQIMDLCTGSGCLALALANAFPAAYVFGIDISETALCYAYNNAQANSIDNVSFIKGHLFDPIAGEENKNKFDLIISNPPYIKTDDINTLQPEIRDWEPIGALDGGADGLNFYREIIIQAGKFLKTNGILMLELGAGCAHETVYIMKDAGYADIGLQKDYAGIERIIQGTWTN
ncbi:MAG TPA: peptide chain release factor N(5)-glutamine methyltransferase [Nitrospiraceae bacterium]|nr:peptide chain release factor N(5)-glutamine methyltransferase [Nitrospiraceae bacterium]